MLPKITNTGWPKKKRPILLFIPKLCCTIFFPYFSGGVNNRPGRLFWHQYGSKWTLYYAAADKIIETYFAAKSVLKNSKNLPKNSDTAAMQEYFGRNNVPDGRAIQRLVAKFRKTGSVADAHKGLDRLSFSIIPENIHNLRKRHEDFPENQYTFFHKKLAFQEDQFWGFSMMTLSSFLTKFWSCRGKLIKIKQNKKHFVKISVNRLKMTLTCWIWTMLTTVAFVGHLLHFLSQTLNCPSIRYIVPAKIYPALPLCQKNWFCGKVRLDDFYRLLRSKSSSWIYPGVKRISQACCLHHLKNMEKNL